MSLKLARLGLQVALEIEYLFFFVFTSRASLSKVMLAELLDLGGACLLFRRTSSGSNTLVFAFCFFLLLLNTGTHL